MALMFDPKKIAEDIAKGAAGAKDVLAGAVDVAQDAANKAAEVAQDAADQVQQKLAEDKRERELKKYRPVKPEEFADMMLNLPKMIVIADASEREGIEVCEGAVGWMQKQDEMDVLYLYEREAQKSGIEFLPMPACDSVYLYNMIEDREYVNLGGYFDKINTDKTAELQRMARLLGARHFTLEEYSLEKTVSVGKSKGKAKAKVPGVNVSAEASAEVRQASESKRSVLINADFPHSSNPQRPEMKWYKNDEMIKELISSRFGEDGQVPSKHYHFEINEETSASAFKSMAGKVDGALKKMGAGAEYSFSADVSTQSLRRLVLDLDFE